MEAHIKNQKEITINIDNRELRLLCAGLISACVEAQGDEILHDRFWEMYRDFSSLEIELERMPL